MRPALHNRGFSLIEIMVVIFIIGVSLSIVALVANQGGPRQDLEDIAERFTTLADFASERAILSNHPVGLLLEPPAWRREERAELEEDMRSTLDVGWRYRFQRMGRGGWEDEPNMEPVELPPAVHLDVLIEGQMWEWENAPESRLPAVAFYPSGEVTQFSIEFRDERLPEFTQNVEVNDWGEVEWLENPRNAAEELEQGGF